MNTRIPTVLATLLAVTLLPVALAQNTPATGPVVAPPLPRIDTARVAEMFGVVQKKGAGAGDYSLVTRSGALTAKSMLRVGENSGALILLPGGQRLRVGASTVLVLNELGANGKYSCKVLMGQVWCAAPGGAATFEIRTPSSVTVVSSALVGVGYELETDQSVVSVGDGAAQVSLLSGAWRGTLKAGQYVRYLRNPQPNIRLRAPEVVAQTAGQKTMWGLLRAENWTKTAPTGDTVARLTRGQDKRLRQLTFSVSVDE